MRIWLDGQCLQSPNSRSRGIGRYTGDLIQALSQIDGAEIVVSLNAGMDHIPQSLPPPGERRGAIETRVWQSAWPVGELLHPMPRRRALSELALAHHVACINPDVAISTSVFDGGDSPATPFRKLPGFLIPSAAIFYDAIPHRFPEHYLPSRTMLDFYAARLAMMAGFDATLCISRFCAAESRALLPGVRAVNISSGVGEWVSDVSGAAPADLQQRLMPYVLYVGGLDWRKNAGLLVDAFRLLPAELRRHRLVVAGRSPPDQEERLRRQWANAGLASDRLVLLGYVSDEDLLRYYAGSALLVQPSRMEGFGLTAAEAMLAGAAVIGSRAGALPEVIGDESLLFDPDSPDELAGVMAKVLRDPDFRAAAIRHGKAHARQFQWHHCAEATFGLCRELAGSSRGYPTVPDARAWTAARLENIDLNPDWIANALARAEPGASWPPPSGPPQS